MTIRLKQNVPCTPANSLLFNNVCWVKFFERPGIGIGPIPYKAKVVNNNCCYVSHCLDIWFRYTNQEEVSSAKFVMVHFNDIDNTAVVSKQINKIVDEINVG